MARRSLIAGVDLPAAVAVEDDPVLVVVRHPDDLAAHERRIAHAADPDERFGAFVDLWIATGPEAIVVRRAALEGAGDGLAPDARAILEQHLTTGLSPTDPLPPCGTSQLTFGVTDARPLTAATDAEADARPRPAAADAVAVAVAVAEPEAEAPVGAAAAVAAVAIADAIADEPGALPSPAATPDGDRPPGGGRRRIAVALAAAAVVAVVVSGLALSRRGDPPAPAAAPGPRTGTSSTVSTAAPTSTKAPTSTTAPTAPDVDLPGPNATAPTVPAPSPLSADVVAADAVVALLDALRNPTAPWPADDLAVDAPARAQVAAIRTELVRTGAAWDVAVLDVAPGSPESGAESATLTVAVAVDHDGVTVQRPDGTIEVAGPGTIIARVELRTGSDGKLEVWSFALAGPS